MVEDNLDYAHSLAIIFRERKERNYEFDIAGTLSEGLAKLQAAKYDVILLDLGLPDGSTPRAVIRAIRDTDPEAGIVVLTGAGSKDDMDHPAREAGADDLLIKPADPVAIAAKIQVVAIDRSKDPIATSASQDLSDIRRIFESVDRLIARR